MNNSELQILAMGDIVIDAFIRMNDAEILKNSKGQDMLAVRYGDKVPYESVEICNAVGNAANAAVSVARLGLQSALFTYVGNDDHGKDCIAELKHNNVHIDFVHTENDKKTNYHYVLWYDVDRTILIKHEKFDYSIAALRDSHLIPKWIYLSSLGENSADIYTQISAYLAEHPEVKLAFQPGVFDIRLGTEKLAHIYSRAEAVCINVEEAQKILGESSRDLKVLLTGMAKLGPKKVFITDGIDGAYAHDAADGDKFSKKYYWIPVYPHKPFERTGAGDAFFSTVISALEMGKPVHEALSWGPINSMSVVQQVGAQKGLLTKDVLLDYLAKAPADYVLKEI